LTKYNLKNEVSSRLERDYREAIPINDTQLANLCHFQGWPYKSHLKISGETFDFPLETLRKAAKYFEDERRTHRRKQPWEPWPE
jgi:hypothetical protein